MFNELIKNLNALSAFCLAANDLKMDIKTAVVEYLRTMADDLANNQLDYKCFQVWDNLQYYTVPCMLQSEIDVACYSGKLEAIKLYKNRTKLSLLLSKRAVETYMDMINKPFFVHKY